MERAQERRGQTREQAKEKEAELQAQLTAVRRDLTIIRQQLEDARAEIAKLGHVEVNIIELECRTEAELKRLHKAWPFL